MSIKQTETGKMIGRVGERNLKDTQNIKHKKKKEKKGLDVKLKKDRIKYRETNPDMIEKRTRRNEETMTQVTTLILKKNWIYFF